jgi:hypothetical protein
VAALEKRQRHLKNPGLATLKFEFLSTLRHGTAFSNLGLSNFSSLPNHNPSPTFRAGHARARNAIGHSAIILRHRRRPSPTLAAAWVCWTSEFFVSVCTLSGEPGERFPDSQHQGSRHAVAVGCDHRRSIRCWLRHALGSAFDGNHLPAYIERCGPAPRPIPALVTGVPHRGRKRRPRPNEVPQGKHHGHATPTGATDARSIT